MAAFSDHEAGNNLDDSHLIAGAFDFTEEVESPFENLDADTEELDIPHFVGDLRALMVDDSEDEVVLDSDDEAISEQKEGKIRECLWRRPSSQSCDIRSSAGSNMTDKVTKSSKEHEFVKLNASSNNCEDEKEATDESQEPGESSEADALKFVDQYLSVSGVNSSPEFKTPKIDKPRSPFASCAKGSQKMAIKASLMTKIGVTTFDWDSDQPDHGGEFFSEKKRELDIQRETHLGGRYKERLQEPVLVNSFQTYSHRLVQNTDPMNKVLQSEELLKQLPGNDSNDRDAPEMFDVVFDTQMAAEAMESLLYAKPPGIISNELEGLKNPPHEETFKQFSSPTNGISSKQKRFTNKSPQMFLELPIIQRAARGESSHENCTTGENLSKPKKKTHEKSFKDVRKKKRKEDSDKENIRGGLVKPYKEVKTFSPVASRTRNGSSVKRSKRTFTNPGFDDFHKRKMGDLKFDTWKWPKKKRTCRNMKQNAKLTSTFYVVPGEAEENFREVFLMSSVRRKARSASIYRSISGKKLGQPSLVDVTNTKSVYQSIPSLGGEEKIKDSSSNGKNKTPCVISSSSRFSDQGLPRKQMHMNNSTSSSLKNEFTRLGYAESLPDFTSKDLRRRRSKVEIRVLFSQSLDDDVVKQQRKILRKLGTCMAKDWSDATHFVADRFARTKKMLEAMSLGKIIVTPLWLESCEQAGFIIDEKNYILRDARKEKEIGFSMPISLSRARTHPLLKDRRVFVTPNVEPDRIMIEKLVKAVHGQVMKDIHEEYKTSDDLLILSCEQDYVYCVPFLDKGAAVYSSELLLNGIIIQKLEYAKHQLFNGHVVMKRYTRKRKKNGR